jgi:hypothetical protein
VPGVPDCAAQVVSRKVAGSNPVPGSHAEQMAGNLIELAIMCAAEAGAATDTITADEFPP